MRAPINEPIIVTNPFGEPGYGVFGKHAGVDLRASVGTPIYAPTDGYVTENYVGTSGIIVLGARIAELEHRFLHLSKIVVKSGSFKEGQLIAYSGNTGNVAAHLHWDVRKPGTAWNHAFSDYINPLSLLNQSQGDTEMITKDDVGLVRIAHSEVGNWNSAEVHAGLHDAHIMAAWVGKPVKDLFWAQWNNGQPHRVNNVYIEQRDKQINDLQIALKNEQNKPPKEVIKEIEKIVEKPVEVIKEVPTEVVREVEAPTTWRSVLNFFRDTINKFLGKDK